ncbi:transglutaminase family protein [Synoicihabitans lomoniglobus]|uniref:Transglutaminase family protein n=1 Tax=Synoicihabitans lomoniglobus TaxID=2909285 RepID=A0AAF0CSV5_9BACT|nr:transglutaminase family protein [Opitutaceae bacterium LMO-M01]WED67430.1 transglutaminase family protein [Opitutaceae bacterium LMO-M01]
MKFRITHTTRYVYGAPVSLSPHLIYLRPREHSRQHLRRFDLRISPDPILTRGQDPLDNELWQARFPELTERMEIESQVEVENTESNPFDFVLKSYAIEFPFEYEPVFKFALGPYLAVPFVDTQHALKQWLDEHFTDRPTGTVDLLTAFTRLFFTHFTYVRRDEIGIQSSITTLQKGSGACRDFAVLFIELCRTLGLAARFVSGYLYAPPGEDERTVGAMHAWVEVYLPGAGWRPIDPTSGVWCDDLFIAVAHAAQAETVNPVQGTYYSKTPVDSQMNVNVVIEPLD